MKSMVRAGLLFIGILTLLVACGGSGPSTPSTVISGVASKGTIVGGTVKAYSILAGAVTSTQLGSTATTGSDGSYSIDVGGYSGPLMVQVTGGTYVDETTGNPIELVTPLRVFVAGVVSGRPRTAAVTPLTEIAARYAENGTLTDDAITAANAKISTEFKVTDILTTSPASDTTYKSSLSAISALGAGSSLDAALTSLKNNIVTNGTLATTVAVTKDKNSALIGGTETITLTVSVLPVQEANTPIDFTISSGGATFANGLGTFSTTTTLPQAVVKSNVAGDYTVTATCSGVSASTSVSFIGSPTVTVTADTTAAVATGSDPITLTATFAPAQAAGTDVTFTVLSGTGRFSNGSTSITTKVGVSNAAQATVYSATAGTVTVTATCLGGTGQSPSLSFNNGVSAYSTLLTALGPVFVVGSDPSLPAGSDVNYQVTGSATIRVVDGIWTKSGAYASSATSKVGSPTSAFPIMSAVYLKCNSAGDFTVTATPAGSATPIGSVTKTCLAATGTSVFNIHLTPTGIGKLSGKQVSNIRFKIIAAPSANTTSIVSRSSSYSITAVEQQTAVATFVNLSPGATLTSSSSLFTATYGYNPSLPSFSVAPVGTVTFSDASTPVTLLPTDFEIK